MTEIHDTIPQGFAPANEQQTDIFEATGYVPGARKVALFKAPEAVISDEADLLQASGPDEFPRGYYEHLATERTARLAVRLGPPRKLSSVTHRGLIRNDLQGRGLEGDEATLAWYVEQYNLGWAAGRRGTSDRFATGYTPHSWDDGYLDAAAGRPKWHVTHCANHDECGEG